MSPRYAIITDIHANWHALKTIIQAVDAENTGHENPLRYWFLGDIIGYGPQPIECIDWLLNGARIEDRWVPGNHDTWLIEPEGVSEDARESLDPHRALLEDPFHAELAAKFRSELTRAVGKPAAEDESLINIEPRSLACEEYDNWKLLFVHASLFGSRRRHYLTAWEEKSLETEFAYIRKKVGEAANAVLFCGHAHYPLHAHQEANGRVALQSIRYYTKTPLRPGLSIINPGSAGQPRDGDPRAAYAVFDTADMTIEFRRLRYPVEEAADALQENGYPRSLSDRLLIGDGKAELALYQAAYRRPYWDLEAWNSQSPGDPPDDWDGRQHNV